MAFSEIGYSVVLSVFFWSCIVGVCWNASVSIASGSTASVSTVSGSPPSVLRKILFNVNIVHSPEFITSITLSGRLMEF